MNECSEIKIFIIHFSVVCGVGAAKLEDTQRLHRDLFHRYNTMVRPIQDQDEPVTINMDLYITAITKLVSYMWEFYKNIKANKSSEETDF